MSLFNFKFRKNKSPDLETVATHITRQILESFVQIRQEHHMPVETAEDKLRLYGYLLSLRPGYTKPAVEQVLDRAAALGIQNGITDGIAFKMLVFTVVMRERALETQEPLTDKDLETIQATIDKTLHIDEASKDAREQAAL